MNKKFYTLVASLLLAGGAFNAASAAIEGTKLASLKDAKPGQVYIIAVNGQGTADLTKGFLDPSQDAGYWAKANGSNANTTMEDVPESALWTIKAVTSNGTKYEFVSLDGKKLAYTGDLNNDGDYKDEGELAYNSAEGVLSQFKHANDKLYIPEIGHVAGNKMNETGWNVAIYAAPDKTLSANDLNAVNGFGKYFNIHFAQKNDKGEYVEFSKLEGEDVFAGNLYATAKNGRVILATTSSETNPSQIYVLPTSVEEWSLDANLKDKVTCKKFASMTQKQARAYEKANKLDENSLAPAEFVFTQPVTSELNDAPLQVAVYEGSSDTEAEYVYVATMNKTGYVTTIKNAAEIATGNSYILFGSSNHIQLSNFYGYAWNIVSSENETLKPNATTNTWVDADYVALTKPEGQWIVNQAGKLVNRETQVVSGFNFAALRQVKDNVYTDGTTKYTLTKVDELGGNKTTEYYGEYQADATNEGLGRSSKIAFNTALGNLYVGLDAKGNVVLVSDVTDAINFDMQPTKTTDNELDAPDKTDVFNIMNGYYAWDKEDKAWNWKEEGDTISYYRYKLAYNGEYLKFNTKGKPELVKEVVNTEDPSKSVSADNFVIKEKDNDIVNVIKVADTDADQVTTSLLSDTTASMLYFDFGNMELKEHKNIYDWEANCQLLIDNKNYVTYRTLAAPDTLEFFRTEYSDEFLYEKGEFLGMTYNRDKYNPAIYVDIAYVRNETPKPLYMLAVDPKITAAQTYCPVHGFNSGCKDEHLKTIPAFVEARYLVSYTDSVAAHSDEVNNKFLWDKKYTTLGFVPATHRVDSLYLPNDTVKGAKKIVLSQTMNPATFAFRIVNENTQDFIIESVEKKGNDYATAWVKWQNGTPVLTSDIDEAEVFNVRETSATPTANDEVSAEAGVSVIATNGAVIIKNAAGKKVAISNILGKSIANETVASDNETVAVPAGIVVVAVEGEEAVKVVVK